MAMSPDATPPAFDAYWRTLAAADRRAHTEEADRALELELDALRARCSDLTAALTQARAAIAVRHDLLTAQSAAIEERDRALAEARSAAAAARADYAAVVTSLRWRAVDVLRRATRAPRAVVARLRGRR